MAAVFHRTREGFVRRYSDGGELRPFHVEQKPRPTDRRLAEGIAAKRALSALWLITDCAEISEIGKERIRDYLRVILWAIEVHCPRIDGEREVAMQRFGLAPDELP